MTKRPTADTITDDQLDQLHTRLADAECTTENLRRLCLWMRAIGYQAQDDYRMGLMHAVNRVTALLDRAERRAAEKAARR